MVESRFDTGCCLELLFVFVALLLAIAPLSHRASSKMTSIIGKLMTTLTPGRRVQDFNSVIK